MQIGSRSAFCLWVKIKAYSPQNFCMKGISILSYNVNGIRAAETKGLSRWLSTVNADVVCIQEIKVSEADFDPTPFAALGYECHIFPAVKKGYSGVAIFSKLKVDTVAKGIGIKNYDDEGRNIRIDVGDVSIMSAYFPSGTTGDERQDVKMKYLDDFFSYMQALKQGRSKIIVAGDYNICHREIDIHNPVSNKDSSGFKPEERAWMEKYFTNGFTDSFRYKNPDAREQYSWWSYRANARNNNKGWRIDYVAVSDVLKENIAEARMFQEAKHSDHCPVFCRLEF